MRGKHFCGGLFVTSKHRYRANSLFLFGEKYDAFRSNYVLQNPLGLLYMSINPVVKFQFGLEAAGSASCSETLFFYSSQQRLLLQPWLPLTGKMLRFGRSLENSKSELAADGCIYKDAKTLEKIQTNKPTTGICRRSGAFKYCTRIPLSS